LIGSCGCVIGSDSGSSSPVWRRPVDRSLPGPGEPRRDAWSGRPTSAQGPSFAGRGWPGPSSGLPTHRERLTWPASQAGLGAHNLRHGPELRGVDLWPGRKPYEKMVRQRASVFARPPDGQGQWGRERMDKARGPGKPRPTTWPQDAHESPLALCRACYPVGQFAVPVLPCSATLIRHPSAVSWGAV